MTTIMIRRNSFIVLAWVGMGLAVCLFGSCNYGYQLKHITNPDSLKLVFHNTAEAKCLFFDVEIKYNGHELSFTKVNGISASPEKERELLSIDDSIAKPMIPLIETLFYKFDTPVYKYWKHSSYSQYHEGDILDVYAYKWGNPFQSRLLIQGVYNQEPLLSEDGHEYMYTPEFKMFVQYLNYISAIIANVDKERIEWYIEEMYDCYNNSKYQVYYPSKDWIESQRLELVDSQNLEDFGF